MADVVRELVARLDLLVDNSGFKNAESNFSRLTDMAVRLGATLSAAFVFREVSGFVKQNIELGASFDIAAQKTGLSAEQIQGWGFVAEKSGVSTETFTKTLGFLNKNLGMAELGLTKGVNFWQQLGINVKNTDGTFKGLN